MRRNTERNFYDQHDYAEEALSLAVHFLAGLPKQDWVPLGQWLYTLAMSPPTVNRVGRSNDIRFLFLRNLSDGLLLFLPPDETVP